MSATSYDNYLLDGHDAGIDGPESGVCLHSCECCGTEFEHDTMEVDDDESTRTRTYWRVVDCAGPQWHRCEYCRRPTHRGCE